MNISYQYLRAFALLTVLSLSAISSLLAQNEIVPNPNAVLLRNVWMVQGQPGDRVGEGVGSVGDINNDSIGDFAWYQRSTHQWTVQLGGETIATTPYQLIDSLGTIPPQPVTGNFFGDGIRAVGFSGFFHVDSSGPRRKLFMRYRVFIVHADTIDTKGGLTFAPDQTWQLGLETTHTTALAADMDQDGDDELIIVVPGTQFDQSVDKRAEIWIFEGGSSFQLDSPSVVLKDTEENFTYFNATIGKLNNDPYPDILIAGDYTDGPPDTDGPPGNRPVRMKFWWGNQNVHNLPTQPERTVQFSDPDYPHISFVRPFLPLFDTDGDSIQEFLLPAADGNWYFYDMSAEGKSSQTRDFTLADADATYQGFNIVYKVGYLNDSLRRYEMIGRTGGVGVGGDAQLVLMSGGKKGANLTYDGYYSASDDGIKSGNVFGVGATIPNCTGSGWDCYATANPSWGGNNEGIVILLEGGAYIPNDDSTLSVEEVATQEHHAAFHIWPNPVIDELHVAWRGDLKNPPSLLVVYDINGREVVSGAVEPWRGEALWKCHDVSAGTYLLIIYDTNGTMIASTTIIKQ
ncbi:MAG: T9SS type A sorting domain-containing protein [Ignavibacteriae bacterium]|nr:T9SS type A sorting domain-containing protein [Ignavibacteriota bacterium]MCB9217481.1 T9SS type A sorting domain-containing protein [Ignavibacteria bacterium]